MTSALTEKNYFVAWIIFYFGGLVGAMLAGAIAGAAIGAAMGMNGYSVESIKSVCGTAGFLVGLPVSYFVFRAVVKRFIIAKLS